LTLGQEHGVLLGHLSHLVLDRLNVLHRLQGLLGCRSVILTLENKIFKINLIKFYRNERLIYQPAPIRSTFEPIEWPGHWTIARLEKLDSPANKGENRGFRQFLLWSDRQYKFIVDKISSPARPDLLQPAPQLGRFEPLAISELLGTV
jgi:hypothetical protein